MTKIFLGIFNISYVVGFLILAVLLVRLIFRKAPRTLFCFFWLLVLVRLCIPVAPMSRFSVIPSTDPIPTDIMTSNEPGIHTGIQTFNIYFTEQLRSESITVVDDESSLTKLEIFRRMISIATYIWMLGMVMLLVYLMSSSFILRYRLRTATKYEKGIFQSDRIVSPFVLGIIKPTIYLPYGIETPDLEQIIAHEKSHIKHMDCLWKPLGFLALSVYWFHPFIWIAYILFCKDIEIACDERVVKDYTREERKIYSYALINQSVKRVFTGVCPVAFGEVGVKERVGKVMDYRNPSFWVLALLFVVGMALTIMFMTNPI